MKLLSTCNLIWFYDTIGRTLTFNNIRWDPIIKNFQIQWKALEDRKKGDKSKMPKIAKALVIIKWTEALTIFSIR